MKKAAVIIGAESPSGQYFCNYLLEKGWHVYGGVVSADNIESTYVNIEIDPLSVSSFRQAAEYVASSEKHVDLLISNIHGSKQRLLQENHTPDFNAMLHDYDFNTLSAVRLVEAFAPLMREGQKRICFVSSCNGDQGTMMSHAALHMAAKIMFNHLGKDGFHIKIFKRDGSEHPSAVHCSNDDDADAAIKYFLDERADDRGVLIQEDTGMIGH